MSFIEAMNNEPALTKTGVNGETVYTEAGVGDRMVALFTMLNRGLEDSYIEKSMDDIIGNISGVGDLADICVLCFQTRDVRGGKGERDLFYAMFKKLYERQPLVAGLLVPLIPEYGCWRDMWELCERVPEMSETVYAHTKTVFLRDVELLEKGELTSLSLLAKWIPREKSETWPGLGRKLCAYIYGEGEKTKTYRKQVSALNRALKTVEVNMCNGTWTDIVPSAVPGRNLKLHMKAFLNVNKDEEPRSTIEDRVSCRQHFLEFIEGLKSGKTQAKGAHVVYPHEVVEQMLKSRYSVYRMMSVEERNEIDILQGIWDSIRTETAKSAAAFKKMVPLCDFSGSMNGKPKLVSLALGILISEINHAAFRDHILTFDSKPIWHSFKGRANLFEKLKSVHDMGEGLSTDFYKACRLIIDKMVAGRVPIGEEPTDLLVLTDMGWDEASRSTDHCKDRKNNPPPWKSQVQRIRDEFAEAGRALYPGTAGWTVPRIIVWNLRAEFKDFQAKAADDGVLMVSGWSPSVLKALQTGTIEHMSPLAGLRSILDDVRYDPVRETVFGSAKTESV
jgi:hypothetical protein